MKKYEVMYIINANVEEEKRVGLIETCYNGGDLLRVSKKCIEMVKEFEGCSLVSRYDRYGDLWEIGYGITSHDIDITGKKIKEGMKISQATADKWLEMALNKKYLPKVMKYQSKYKFNTSQIDALVSFAYNIGSIDGLTQNGKRTKKEISESFALYKKSGGVVLNGLIRRREAEKKLFNSGPKLFDEGFPKLPTRGYFQLGDKSEEVKKVQRFLSWMNLFADEISGIYDRETVSAVKTLQQTIPTTQNGKFGNKCLPFAKKYKK